MKVKDLINILSKFDPEANIMHELTGFEELPGSYDGTATRIVLPKKCKYNCLAELYDALDNGEITHDEYDKILSKSHFEFSPVPNKVVFEIYTLSDWLDRIDHEGKRVRSETFGSYEWWCPSDLKEIKKDIKSEEKHND